MKSIPFSHLVKTDLFLDANYEASVGLGGEPINPLFGGGLGNRGGFRAYGSIVNDLVKFVVLLTTFEDHDWPDHLDVENGIFTYYGDNKTPGSELHKTKKTETFY